MRGQICPWKKMCIRSSIVGKLSLFTNHFHAKTTVSSSQPRFATIFSTPAPAASGASSLVLAAPSADVAQDRPDAFTTYPKHRNAPVMYPITTAM